MRSFFLCMLIFAPIAKAACLVPNDLSRYHFPTLEQEVDSADAIAIIAVSSSYGVRGPSDFEGYEAFFYTVRIIDLIDGQLPSSIVMRASNDSGGYRMREGETHLLFLTNRGRYFTASICGNSQTIAKSQITLQKLGLRPKDWHQSPSGSPMSSNLYRYVEWQNVKMVAVGMCEPQAVLMLGGPLQYYNHPMNAIVFTDHPARGRVEVAFKLSDAICIEDISFKLEGAH